VDSISITVTGRLGADPRQGTTKPGKPLASLTVAADVRMRNGNGDREYDTRWYQVWCHGPLAEHVAESLTKGDRVTVRADDVNCRAWTRTLLGTGRAARSSWKPTVQLWTAISHTQPPSPQPAPLAPAPVAWLLYAAWPMIAVAVTVWVVRRQDV
jgi:Single-strand binding protein family